MMAPLSMQSPGGLLTIEFTWHVDRYTHVIRSAESEVLASVEGGGDDAWPTSPPIQQLSLETIDGRDVLLGVGAAGRGHWSISVRGTRRDHLDALRIELACRSKANPVNCRSTYDLASTQPGTASMKVLAHLGDVSAATESARVVITPPEPIGTTTTQWAYDVCVTSEWCTP